MKELKNLVGVIFAALFFIVMYMFCDQFAQDIRTEYADQIKPSLIGTVAVEKDKTAAAVGQSTQDDIRRLSVEKQVENMIRQNYLTNANIAVMGDVLCQRQQLACSYTGNDGIFNFQDAFTYIKPALTQSDYTIATLKTTFAGRYRGYNDEYYGYTTADGHYNSPDTLANALADAGVSLVNTATNHALDSNISGLEKTIDILNQAGIEHVGTRKTAEETGYEILEINDMRIGIIGYTNHTNGIELDASSLYAVNTLNDYDEKSIETLCSEITAVKAETDFVIVMLNFGSVDSDNIEEEQSLLAEKLAKAGADAILGTSSRVMKPVEMKTVQLDNGFTRNCLVLYGMGAIYSSESYEDSQIDSDISAVFQLELTRDAIEGVFIKTLRVVPYYSNWVSGLVQPIPVCEAKDTSRFASLLDDGDMERINAAYEHTIEHLVEGTTLQWQYEDYGYSISLK